MIVCFYYRSSSPYRNGSISGGIQGMSELETPTCIDVLLHLITANQTSFTVARSTSEIKDLLHNGWFRTPPPPLQCNRNEYWSNFSYLFFAIYWMPRYLVFAGRYYTTFPTLSHSRISWDSASRGECWSCVRDGFIFSALLRWLHSAGACAALFFWESQPMIYPLKVQLNQRSDYTDCERGVSCG